ncbi:Hypothetical protein precursor [Flavobacterium indicum GPTSA100-9 = DSM 17447]|uniref:Outer membrane protein beta-barrel domain-containing protein n=1 Tax=Flavobacterium indicum (strain DSM 17447 / CIP 109464 / GPTSA100-9) TaxID=1094466 RepID=H8XTM8_FLAIG|nr:hypothetical protein [Flavobacterium indicum]CCG53608.1 Hypothetical protein precursor [Flavobacterium indicum GPTSA100-9 = DSM 17447]
MKKQILIILLFSVSLNVFAQEKNTQKTSFNFLSNQISILANNNATFLTMGGPGITYTNTKTEISLRFLASLRFDLEKNLTKPNESIRPLMGFGTQIRYKKIVITPAAFYFYNNKWEYATGFGFLLGKNNK